MMVKDMKCSVCDRAAESTCGGKPYCNKHYQLVKRYGTPEGRKRKRSNQYIVNGDVLEIVTSNGNLILADASDKEKIEKYSWCISKTGYAVANMRGRVVKMHRYILGILENPNVLVDHKNRNPLDNRRSNLRLCTRAENTRNIGVSKRNKIGVLGIRKTPAGKYNVRIVHDGVEHHIGNYDSLDAAIKARNDAEDQYHGEFASHKGKE